MNNLLLGGGNVTELVATRSDSSVVDGIDDQRERLCKNRQQRKNGRLGLNARAFNAIPQGGWFRLIFMNLQNVLQLTPVNRKTVP